MNDYDASAFTSWAIFENFSGSRLALPIKSPSTLPVSMNELALVSLTEPPYKTQTRAAVAAPYLSVNVF